jgi:signal transduction histidine kinase
VQRVAIVGSPGSGKSTLARTLSSAAGLRHVELDALWHRPGWTSPPVPEFRLHVAEELTDGGWVVDGNYRMVQDIVHASADTIVWIDLPRRHVTARVIRRTAWRVLTRKELWAMEDQVKRVEKMAVIGEMAAGLAHEIKNPLASLAGSIQILKDGIQLDADHARLMKIVLREADRLSSLVNNFLLFARPPAGKSEIIDLSRAITETVELFEKDGACREKITIKKKVSNGICIQMDPIHFRQVLWNLLLNAAEAIDGSGSIDINLFSAKGRKACMEISDTGCGISAEVIGSIFDPFFTTKHNGTGLGLSIVHSILESYDSHLEVRSRQGTGTTFAVHLKRSEPPTHA